MFMTNQHSIQEVLFFPQMRPEPKQKVITPKDFIEVGVSKDWAEYLIPAGFASPEDLRDAKPTVIQQKLNGYRKKNKLDIPALTPDVIEGWQANIE
jgi:lysyl-tRNA synthetase class 2